MNLGVYLMQRKYYRLLIVRSESLFKLINCNVLFARSMSLFLALARKNSKY